MNHSIAHLESQPTPTNKNTNSQGRTRRLFQGIGFGMSTSGYHRDSTADLQHSINSSSPPLSRSSTFTRTIPLEDKTIHVVRSPTEGYKLKDVEWVIQGSREHLEYLRASANTLGSKRSELRRKYLDVVDEVEILKSDFDAVSQDLENLSKGQDLELHATFNKFGRTANLQVHDAPTGNEGEREKANTGLKLFKTPSVRQYFHRGVLYRSVEMEETRPTELFIDLFYVGIIAINAQNVARNPTGFQLHVFALTFIPSWRIWTDLRDLVSTFDTDDVMQRMGILFTLTCLLGFTLNMTQALDETLTMIIAFYVTARLFLAALHVFLATLLPYMRPILFALAFINTCAAAVWIGSIYVELPNRYAMLWVAIGIDWFGYLGLVILIRIAPRINKRLGEILGKTFSYYPAVNIEHHVDRINAFITLAFGHIILSVLYQSSAHFGLNAFFGKAALSMCIAYGLNWLYFDVDNTNLEVHAIRRHIVSSMIYGLAHLPFIMGITLVGAALEYLVIAHDCPDANPEDLGEDYQLHSEQEVNNGLRWFFCAGLAMGLFCMGIISLTHRHVNSVNLNLKKRYRLGIRGCVCLIILFLPLSHDLNSLQLIGIVTALLWGVIAVETWGNADCKHIWIGEKKKRVYVCKFDIRCVQGQENVSEEVEKRSSEDGDIIFGV